MSPYEKTLKKDDIDDFWDIADMLPEKKKPIKKAPSFVDTEAVTVSTGAKNDNSGAMKIPPRMTAPKETPKGKKYVPENDFIREVTISPWPTDFNFYQKFRSDALRFLERTHAPCEYVYFFSYMPQYDQMTMSQLAYYLYWREEFKHGNVLKADNSYVFLFAYEIINLPDKIPPKEGVSYLAKLWRYYRAEYCYIDKYFGEWLCEYCLIHEVAPDPAILADILPDAMDKIAVPEFFLSRNDTAPALIAAIYAFDYRKSKYYEEYKEAYDEHMPAALSHVVSSVIMQNLEKYAIPPVRLVRDSFSGAVVCRREKYKIELLCCPLRRSYEFRQLISRIGKLCENQLRAAFGIKSRFNPTGLDDDVKRAANDYFDRYYPDRAVSHKKKNTGADESYLSLYEPENKGPADINRALAIEAAAWETAELLEVEEETAEPQEMSVSVAEVHIEPITEPLAFSFAEPAVTDSGDFGFLLELDDVRKQAIIHAAKGDFVAFCRSIKQMPDVLASELNELAMDAMGDIMIEEDFSLVSDYEEEISEVLNIKEAETLG